MMQAPVLFCCYLSLVQVVIMFKQVGGAPAMKVSGLHSRQRWWLVPVVDTRACMSAGEQV